MNERKAKSINNMFSDNNYQKTDNKELGKIELDDEMIEKVTGGAYKPLDKDKGFERPYQIEDEG